MPQKKRFVKSVKDELVKKAREAMLAAVQIYNNPQITFKAEAYITLSIVSWTYLLHAYFRNKKIDYRFYKQTGKRKKYDTTKSGAHKYWDLDTCLNNIGSTLDSATKSNLRFLIGLRNEIEHQMTNRIDELISAKTHAAALNFNYYIKEFFGDKYSVDEDLALCIQFTKLDAKNTGDLKDILGLNDTIKNYIIDFEKNLDETILIDSRYSYKIFYTQFSVNHAGQADSVLEFVKLTPEQAENLKGTILVKETEKRKYIPSEIVKKMKDEGYTEFSITQHTRIWQALADKKETLIQYGTPVSKTWYWYESWIDYVRDNLNKKDLK